MEPGERLFRALIFHKGDQLVSEFVECRVLGEDEGILRVSSVSGGAKGLP